MGLLLNTNGKFFDENAENNYKIKKAKLLRHVKQQEEEKKNELNKLDNKNDKKPEDENKKIAKESEKINEMAEKLKTATANEESKL